ncbi:MAG: hypothetical protein MUQ65_09630, partial [Armatimonadetes bacterium]|nr:hypothetical protein [Armatimonadota bacterium]
HFGVNGWERENLVTEEDKLRTLEQRIVLSFTGKPHFSGTNNWNMIKNFIEDQSGCRECLREIGAIAAEMREAVSAFDLEAVAELLDKEWQCRKQLAEGVTTPQIDKLVAAAKAAGGLASKIMGAGGGGCMISIVGEGKREAVEGALAQAGATIMPFLIARTGLMVREIPSR